MPSASLHLLEPVPVLASRTCLHKLILHTYMNPHAHACVPARVPSPSRHLKYLSPVPNARHRHCMLRHYKQNNHARLTTPHKLPHSGPSLSQRLQLLTPRRRISNWIHHVQHQGYDPAVQRLPAPQPEGTIFIYCLHTANIYHYLHLPGKNICLCPPPPQPKGRPLDLPLPPPHREQPHVPKRPSKFVRNVCTVRPD